MIRQVIVLTFSTRSLERFILLPIRALISVMSLIFALVATYVAKNFLGFKLLSLFLQGLHERLLHSLLGLLDNLLHQGIKLTLYWDMICSFTQEASNLTCGHPLTRCLVWPWGHSSEHSLDVCPISPQVLHTFGLVIRSSSKTLRFWSIFGSWSLIKFHSWLWFSNSSCIVVCKTLVLVFGWDIWLV